MISVTAAREIIAQHIIALPPVTIPISQASGKLLAEDVYAARDIPAFPQSSMDGYAFSYAVWKQNSALIIDGKILLSPALLLLKWANMKQTAAISAFAGVAFTGGICVAYFGF